MTWYIKRGDELIKGKPITFGFSRVREADAKQSSLMFKNDLLKCDNASASKYPGSQTSVCCTVTADLTSIPLKTWSVFRGWDKKQ
jgi:hypothetical protein